MTGQQIGNVSASSLGESLRNQAEASTNLDQELHIEISEALENLDLASVDLSYESEEILGNLAQFLRLKGTLVLREPGEIGEPVVNTIGEISAWQGVDWRRSDPSKGIEGLKYHITVEIELGDKYYMRFGLVESKAEKFVEALNNIGVGAELKRI